MVEPDKELLERLIAWYENQLARPGIQAEQLPALADLQTIAATPGVNRQMLSALPLEAEARLMPFATGVMAEVRQLQRERAESPPPAPAPAAPVATPTPPTKAGGRRRSAPVDQPAPAPEAAPAPAPSPSSVPAAAAAPPAPGGKSFASFDYLSAIRPPFVLEPTFKPQADGRLWLGWQAPEKPSPYVLYRVVAGDGSPPVSPDDAEQVQVTTAPEAYDRALGTSVRYLQVWVYAGADEAAARSSQPVLHRQGMVIAPPPGAMVHEDHGTVIVSWELAPGVHRVELQRVPVGRQMGSGAQEGPEQLATQDGVRSYHDTDCRPGQEYEYQLFSVIKDPVTLLEHMSEPVSFPVRVSASLTAVPELRVSQRLDDVGRTLVDLEWDQAPGDEVRIYRTDEPPVIGAELNDIPVTALGDAGLADSDRQRLPITVTDRIGQMRGITWPDDMPRVHFTAVSVAGDDAHIGDTATRSRTTAITDVRLLQRVNWQLLSFSWPRGTVSVDVHLSPRGTSLEESSGPPLRTITESEYRRDGGTLLELPWQGCELHLVPVSFYEKVPVRGRTTTHTYRGLVTLQYRLRVVTSEPDPRTGQAATDTGRRVVEVYRVGGGPGGPSTVQVELALVASRERLPLSDRDNVVELGRTALTVDMTTQPTWIPTNGDVPTAAWQGHTVRLFARLQEATGLEVALLDPPFETLRIR